MERQKLKYLLQETNRFFYLSYKEPIYDDTSFFSTISLIWTLKYKFLLQNHQMRRKTKYRDWSGLREIYLKYRSKMNKRVQQEWCENVQ